jgi:hypothetical protein
MRKHGHANRSIASSARSLGGVEEDEVEREEAKDEQAVEEEHLWGVMIFSLVLVLVIGVRACVCGVCAGLRLRVRQQEHPKNNNDDYQNDTLAHVAYLLLHLLRLPKLGAAPLDGAKLERGAAKVRGVRGVKVGAVRLRDRRHRCYCLLATWEALSFKGRRRRTAATHGGGAGAQQASARRIRVGPVVCATATRCGYASGTHRLRVSWLARLSLFRVADGCPSESRVTRRRSRVIVRAWSRIVQQLPFCIARQALRGRFDHSAQLWIG